VARSLEFSGLLRFRPTWTEPLDLVDVVDSSDLSYRQALSNGTGSGQANAYYRDVITLAGSATESIDLEDLTIQLFGGSGSLGISVVKVLLAKTLTGGATITLGNSLKAFLQDEQLFYATNMTTGWPETSLTVVNNFSTACEVELHVLGVNSNDVISGSG